MSQRPALPKSAPDLDCSESPPRPVLLPHFLIRFQGVRRLQCVCTCGGGGGSQPHHLLTTETWAGDVTSRSLSFPTVK